MHAGLTLLAAVGCLLVSLIFGKRPDSDWGSALMAALFAGAAGALLLVSIGSAP